MMLGSGSMTTTATDPAHASALLAESVVGLVRAELHLALTRSRATGIRVVRAVVLGTVALLLVQATFFVLVLSPFLWAFRPGATLVALSLSLGIALTTSLLAQQRFRALGRTGA
jgi:hypothetical protein